MCGLLVIDGLQLFFLHVLYLGYSGGDSGGAEGDGGGVCNIYFQKIFAYFKNFIICVYIIYYQKFLLNFHSLTSWRS